MKDRKKLVLAILVSGLIGVAFGYAMGCWRGGTDWSGWLAGTSPFVMAIIIFWIEIIKPWWLKPKILIEFANKEPFCRHATGLVTEGVPDNSASQYHIRIRVQNKGRSLAKRLRGKLADLVDETGKSHESFDPAYLHWTSIEAELAYKEQRRAYHFRLSYDYLEPIDLNPGEWDYLDIFATGKKLGDEVKISTTQTPRGCMKDFKMSKTKVRYLKITIYGENSEPVTEAYELVWEDTSKYDDIKMSRIEEWRRGTEPSGEKLREGEG